MNDPPRNVHPADDRTTPKRGTSRWQLAIGILGVVLVVWLALQTFGGGEHGPGRHGSTGEQTQTEAPATPTEQAPADGVGHDPSQSDH